MELSRFMTKELVQVQMDDSLARVKSIFDRASFRHLLVVTEGQLVGVVSDRDLLRAISPVVGTAAETARDTATLNKRVHQIMSRQLITLGPEASVHDAIALFNQHRISCIPVVDKNQRPVGIVSWRDIMRTLKPKNPEQKAH